MPWAGGASFPSRGLGRGSWAWELALAPCLGDPGLTPASGRDCVPSVRAQGGRAPARGRAQVNSLRVLLPLGSPGDFWMLMGETLGQTRLGGFP